MAKSKNLQRRSISRRYGTTLRKVSSPLKKVCGDVKFEKKHLKASEMKEWENAICSVCMEFPHNAVLLLCSSYDKGCRPYMCATSHRFSNCLEQYKKAYTKVPSNQTGLIDDNIDLFGKSGLPDGKSEISELLCPLCRGQVKGWTVVEPARRYLNTKKRTCMQDNCSFIGTYKKLKKHVKLVHPVARRPRDVDPTHAEKWKKFENERDRSDVFSTIRSTMPGAIVIGDYVIERNYHDFPMDSSDEDDYLSNSFFRLPTFVGRWNNPRFPLDEFNMDFDSSDEEEFQRQQEARASVASRRSASRNAWPRSRMFVGRRAGRSRTGR